MLAREKMAMRVALVEQLTMIDTELTSGLASSFRGAAEARQLLIDRRAVCAEMLTVGYQPWAIPTIVEESKAI